MKITIRGKQLTLRGVQRYFELMGQETRQYTDFWMNAGRRQRQKREFDACKTLEDHYNFAKSAVGLMQHLEEITGVLEYVAAQKPQYVCEIGTYEGGTNMLIAQGIPTIKIMVGVDLFVQHTTQLRYFCRPDRKVHYLNGSSYTQEMVDKVSALLEGNKLDFLFIDGDHRYDGVKQDFLLYRHLVREGGYIAFHDIVPDHKTRFGKDTGMWAGDVPVFWAKIKQHYPHKEFVKDYEQDGLGIGALTYSSSVVLPSDL